MSLLSIPEALANMTCLFKQQECLQKSKIFTFYDKRNKKIAK